MIKKALVVFFAILLIFPLFHALCLSLFSPSDFYSTPARFFPSALHFENYKAIFDSSSLLRPLINTLFVAMATGALRILIILPASYAISNMNFRFKKAISAILIIPILIPQDVVLHSNYRITAALSLLDTLSGIIVACIYSASSFIIIHLSLSSVPGELIGAGKIDGADDHVILIKIIVPLIRNTIALIFIQAFLNQFNSYLWPLAVSSSEESRMLQIAINQLGFIEDGNMGAVFASITFIFILSLFLILSMRKRIFSATEESLLF